MEPCKQKWTSRYHLGPVLYSSRHRDNKPTKKRPHGAVGLELTLTRGLAPVAHTWQKPRGRQRRRKAVDWKSLKKRKRSSRGEQSSCLFPAGTRHLSKEPHAPWGGWASSNQATACIVRKGGGRITLGLSVSVCLSVSVSLSLWVCLSLLELGHCLLPPSRLCPWTEYTTSSPASPACGWQVECVLSLFLRSIVSVHAKLLQSCLTPGDPMDCSPPGSSVQGILQAIIVWWVAIPSSRGASWRGDGTHISRVYCIGSWVLYH